MCIVVAKIDYAKSAGKHYVRLVSSPFIAGVARRRAAKENKLNALHHFLQLYDF